ncbi:hypothetical protein TNCV_2155481 [Trichonephila clavipes]|nr:hypothetical protein TNCV_2155481 [Trichonephila clavipes]
MRTCLESLSRLNRGSSLKRTCLQSYSGQDRCSLNRLDRLFGGFTVKGMHNIERPAYMTPVPSLLRTVTLKWMFLLHYTGLETVVLPTPFGKKSQITVLNQRCYSFVALTKSVDHCSCFCELFPQGGRHISRDPYSRQPVIGPPRVFHLSTIL